MKRLEKSVSLPSIAKKGDAGFDLQCNETIELLPGERKTVSTGLQIAVPENHVGIIKDRGSVSLQKGLHCLAGVFDTGYRGEWKIVMANLGKEKVTLEKGMRFCQAIILPLAPVTVVEVKELNETERSHTGFGSSGE